MPTLSALGCLERRAGNLEAAAEHLEAALAADRQHVPSLHELALVREEQVGQLVTWWLLSCHCGYVTGCPLRHMRACAPSMLQ